MQRINNLLQKLSELASKNGEPEIIDIDLMLDYTKVMYADLLEMRGRIALNTSLVNVQANTTTETQDIAHKPIDEATERSSSLPGEENQDSQLPTVAETEKNAEPIIARNDTDIRHTIGINDKYLFISELFNNNTNAYEEVLTKLNGFNFYPEAVAWLDEVHSEHHWDDDNEHVILFYNIVSNYFASK